MDYKLMKNRVTLSILMMVSILNGIAQDRISVSNTKMNVAYLGIPNPISIVMENTDCDDLIVSVNQGKIEKTDDCYYTYIPETAGVVKISVSSKSDTIIKSISYRVRHIPDPKPTIGGTLTGGKIERGTLVVQSGLIALLRDFDINVFYEIMHFEMITSSDNYYNVESSESPLLTAAMKTDISKIENGGWVVFTDITIKDPYGRTRLLSDNLIFEVLPTED